MILLPAYWLLSKIARTKFESKSQQTHSFNFKLTRCYQRSQEQSLKANHNSEVATVVGTEVVIKDRKNKVWKQITTSYGKAAALLQLLSKIARTKFESKSQRMGQFRLPAQSCYQRSQEQSLKANHNGLAATTTMTMLLSKIARTKFESKSQHQASWTVLSKSCYQRSQEQSLKANHN